MIATEVAGAALRHQWKEKISELIHAYWSRIFFQKKFCSVRQRLQQSVRPHPMRSPARLHVRWQLCVRTT